MGHQNPQGKSYWSLINVTMGISGGMLERCADKALSNFVWVDKGHHITPLVTVIFLLSWIANLVLNGPTAVKLLQAIWWHIFAASTCEFMDASCISASIWEAMALACAQWARYRSNAAARSSSCMGLSWVVVVVAVPLVWHWLGEHWHDAHCLWCLQYC